MAISLTTPVTGASQTGLTTPTYTVAVDSAPDTNMKQWAVTALGGTQTGVTISSGSSPFTVNFVKPKAFKALGKPNPVTGLIKNVPMNVYKVITRKGVTPLAGQPVIPMPITTEIPVPAGVDIADPLNLKAALSLHIGALQQVAAGLGDTTISNSL